MDNNFGVKYSFENERTRMDGPLNEANFQQNLFVDSNQYPGVIYDPIGPNPETNLFWVSPDVNNFDSLKWGSGQVASYNSDDSTSLVTNKKELWGSHQLPFPESDVSVYPSSFLQPHSNNLLNPTGYDSVGHIVSNSHNIHQQSLNNKKRASVPANPVSFKHPSYFPPSTVSSTTNAPSGSFFPRDKHASFSRTQSHLSQPMRSNQQVPPMARTASTMSNFPNSSVSDQKSNSRTSSFQLSGGRVNIPLAPTIQSVNNSLSVYEVQFKCHTHFYMIGSFPNSPLALSVGDFVVVEADRGEDLGIITEILSKEALIEKRVQTSKLHPFSSSGVAGSTIGKIKRVATAHDQLLLPQKAFDEEHILQTVKELAYHKYQFPLTLHDAVYQFDRHKLTFFYSSEVRIDFRDFVRELFGKYHTRIWMHEIHYANVPLIKFDNWASIALATGMKFSS